METLRTHRWLLALLLAGGLIRLALSWQGVQDLTLRGNLYDDSFYSFQIARNLAHGNGPTFDGIHLTNGFQPLYVFLLVPVFLLAGADPVLPLKIALTYLSVLSLLTAVLLYALCRRYVSQRLALLGAFLWLVSPTILRHDLNGLETAQAAFLVALSIYWYVTRVRGFDGPPGKNHLLLGLFLGLAIFSRVDALLLVPPMLIDYVLVRRGRAGGRALAAGVARVALVTFLVCLPWMIFSIVTVKTLSQHSGQASRLINLAYGSFFGLGSGEEWPGGPSLDFVGDHFLFSLRVLKAAPPAYSFFRFLEKAEVWTGAGGAFLLLSDLLILSLTLGLVVWLWRRVRVGLGNGFRELHFTMFYALAMILAYSAVIFGAVFFTRYYYPIYFLLTLYFIVALGRLLDWSEQRLGLSLAGAFAAIALFFLVTNGVMVRNQLFVRRTGFPFLRVAEWIEKNTEEGDVIGVFQAGTIGYFSNRRIINLDGKVNPEALGWLREDRLGDYVLSAHLDYVIDHKNVVDLFLLHPPDGVNPALKLEPVADHVGAAGWEAYRVSDRAVTLRESEDGDEVRPVQGAGRN